LFRAPFRRREPGMLVGEPPERHAGTRRNGKARPSNAVPELALPRQLLLRVTRQLAEWHVDLRELDGEPELCETLEGLSHLVRARPAARIDVHLKSHPVDRHAAFLESFHE